MNTVKWAISTEIFRKPGYPRLDKALERNEIDYFHSDFNQNTRTYTEIPYQITDCVVLYGPIQFIQKMNKGYVPGAFGFKKETNTSFYMSQLPLSNFFNSNRIYLPFGSLVETKSLLKDLFGRKLFIRPDSGFKSFTGFSVNIDDLEYELSALKQIKNIGNHELCLISDVKEILGEYRIVICNKKVLTGSQYRWDNKLDVRIDVHDDAWLFAEEYVAKAEWQLDTCYTVDIFLSNNGPKIGEFNSFSSAGLYNCDMDKIVQEVSKLAWSEWKD